MNKNFNPKTFVELINKYLLNAGPSYELGESKELSKGIYYIESFGGIEYIFTPKTRVKMPLIANMPSNNCFNQWLYGDNEKECNVGSFLIESGTYHSTRKNNDLSRTLNEEYSRLRFNSSGIILIESDLLPRSSIDIILLDDKKSGSIKEFRTDRKYVAGLFPLKTDYSAGVQSNFFF